MEVDIVVCGLSRSSIQLLREFLDWYSDFFMNCVGLMHPNKSRYRVHFSVGICTLTSSLTPIVHRSFPNTTTTIQRQDIIRRKWIQLVSNVFLYRTMHHSDLLHSSRRVSEQPDCATTVRRRYLATLSQKAYGPDSRRTCIPIPVILLCFS